MSLDFVWSVSKANTAAQCLYKFKRIYVDKVPERTHALVLGNAVHDVIAKELINRNTDVDDLIRRLDENPGTDPEIYAMAPNITSFVSKWVDLSAREGLEATIEKKYAVTKDMKQTEFMGSDAYIRGVFDMWWYNEQKKQLAVLDHKTDKNAGSKKYVKEHQQLNLYVYMLTHMFNLNWEDAHIALHFVRHGKIVWAKLTRDEVDSFGKRFLHFLGILEERIVEAYETNNWEKTPGFYCRWCSFKNECSQQLPH